MDETGNVGETGDMRIGESKTFTVTLSAGRYLLMCNEIGHYGSGIHMAFTVNLLGSPQTRFHRSLRPGCTVNTGHRWSEVFFVPASVGPNGPSDAPADGRK